MHRHPYPAPQQCISGSSDGLKQRVQVHEHPPLLGIRDPLQLRAPSPPALEPDPPADRAPKIQTHSLNHVRRPRLAVGHEPNPKWWTLYFLPTVFALSMTVPQLTHLHQILLMPDHRQHPWSLK